MGEDEMSWALLRKLVFVSLMIGIAALLFQDGNISSSAGSYIVDQFQELENTL
jgi:hypothetical protein